MLGQVITHRACILFILLVEAQWQMSMNIIHHLTIKVPLYSHKEALTSPVTLVIYTHTHARAHTHTRTPICYSCQMKMSKLFNAGMPHTHTLNEVPTV